MSLRSVDDAGTSSRVDNGDSGREWLRRIKIARIRRRQQYEQRLSLEIVSVIGPAYWPSTQSPDKLHRNVDGSGLGSGRIVNDESRKLVWVTPSSGIRGKASWQSLRG